MFTQCKPQNLQKFSYIFLRQIISEHSSIILLAFILTSTVSTVSTALLSSPGISAEEAASIRHVTPRPPMTRRQLNFCDKGMAVKSERAGGVSLRHPLHGHRQRPRSLWNQLHPDFCRSFFIFSARLQQHLDSGLKSQDHRLRLAAVRCSNVGRQGSR